MCDKCAPSTTVTRLLGRSGFGNTVGSIEAAASEYTQEIASLNGRLMQKNDSVCVRRVRLKIFVRVWSDKWKSLEREFAMMFHVTLMCV